MARHEIDARQSLAERFRVTRSEWSAVVVSLMLALVILPANAALPASTQNLSDTYWTNNTGGATVNGFNLVETTGATRASSGNSIYYTTAVVKDDPGVAGNYYYELTWTADGVDLGTFDLDGMRIESFGGNFRIDFSAVSGGLPVSQSFTYNGAVAPVIADLNVATFNNISAFTVRVTQLSGSTSVANMDLQQLVMTDLQAPGPPTVTNANISISGATGTGGAYKIGDTVTATWNNTAGGDNNAVAITGVTVDFSQFGGGAAVAASNSSGTWTATYTITAGAIDAANRNVSVTASNVNGPTTVADTTNATVDSVAPQVTNANISISGASGVGGAFKIGDTVTATWNNTAGGDNNSDTISSVTVNFSQFGGGAAVVASNSSGTWTATYTLVSGAIDTTNRNIAVTATDNAGNTTTTADSTNATVDNIAPTVSSITVSGTPASSDTSMTFTVSFNESVSNLSTDDFTLVDTGTATGTINSVSAASGTSVNVAITGITGNGTLKLNLNAGTNIADDAGNSAPATFTTGSTHTVAIPVAPNAPTIGTASAGDAQASVAFTAPAYDGGSAITGYTVTSNPGGITASGASSPIIVTGLSNGTSYTFTVTATNIAGTGSASAASNAVTPKAGQVITFTNPGAQNFGTTPTLTASSTSTLTVTFSSSTTGVCTITSGGALTFVTAGTCTIDADQAGNAAYNAATTVSRSFTVNAIVPGAPTVGTATAGDTQASITFTAPASNGGSAITGYDVTSNPGGITASGASSPIIVTGLSNGTAYTFTVTATNIAGNGSASAASNAATPKANQTITFTNPGAQNFGTAPTLSASATSTLTVTFSSSTSGVCTITSGGSLTLVTAGICTIDADQAGDAAYNAATTVARSFIVNAVVPGAPTVGIATAGDTQASVTFTAPASNGGSAITGYTVTSNPGGLTGTGATSPLTVSGLTNGVSYTFTVTATNIAGSGGASSASNAITPASGQTITFAHPGAQNFGTTPTLSASSTSGLTVTFTSSTTGVCTITSGGALSFVTTGTCIINADQAGNASYSPALQVSRSFTVNAVIPGAPTIGTATVAGPGEVEVSFTAPTFTGGASITGYTVTSSPGGITATGAASPITVTGLTAGTPYTFTVTATNVAGTGSPSAASASVTPVPALLASDSAMSVGYDAAATLVNLDITGTPTSVAIVTAPSHGSAVVNGTTITYQPATGYAGSDSFSYTASDAYTTTAPATVSVTVSTPSLTLDATAPPAATGGSAYSHDFAASGGAAPYLFAVVSGALPTGLTLAGNGTLSGVPTQAGSFGFTVQATDSSSGTGPFTAQRAYTLQVQSPTIAFVPDSWPEATYGTAFEHTIAVSGGTAPYTFALTSGTLPQGVALATSGVVAGTPEIAGSFDITVQVRDANDFTASQVFTMTVTQAAQAITGFTANPTAPVFVADGSFAVAAQGGASAQPLVFASTTTAVCTVAGNSVTMHTVGRCSLTADQAGDGNFQAAAQVRLDVDIAAAVPTLVWPEALSKMLGESAFVLDNPQSTSAGAFTFTSSSADVASIDGRTVTLHAEGITVITATQAAAGNYAAASIDMRLTVTSRPDPTRDPGVTGLLQAQVDASVRFATAQQSNIRDRLRHVRSGANTSSSNLTLAYAGAENSPGLSVPLGQATSAFWPSMPQGWGAWLSGTATFGRSRGASHYDFHTDGITLGFDRILSDSLLVGIAGSLATDDSRLDANNASRMQADQHSLAVYGLWRTGDHVFIDAMTGAGRLDFDMHRWSTDANAASMATRKGDQWFASVSMGYEHRGPAMTLTGYSRAESSRTTLDAYREQGLSMYDLAYGRHTAKNSAIALGLEGSHLLGDAGRFRPFWTVEYRKVLENKGDATMNYALLPQADDFRFGMRSYNDSALSLSAGLDVRMTRGWLLSLLFGHEQVRQSSNNNSIGLRLSYGTQGSAMSTELGADVVPATRCAPNCATPFGTD